MRALGSCQRRGQRVSSAGERVGRERRKRKEKGQREIETLTRANKACCEKMDGWIHRWTESVRATERVGTNPDQASERYDPLARTYLYTLRDIHTL